MLGQSLIEAISKKQNLFVQQKKEWTEIIIDWETSNRYAVMDDNKNVLGMIAERAGGVGALLKRLILRSHRGFEVDVVNQDGSLVMRLERSFFFFFSDLYVSDAQGQSLGSIHRRFGILHKKYDLKDKTGRIFATIASPLWRLWTFPVSDTRRVVQDAKITKRWGGVLREMFTDADTYCIDFGQGVWEPDQREVIFAASISIDFDFFEDNQRS